ncbi:MAG: type IV secretion protein IcmD [Gammaproteobacteria bacterium]|nr:type IV secretion protein IcmD [Gammaproteobacteria bacterium]
MLLETAIGVSVGYAAGSAPTTFGGMASTITSSFGAIAQLITAASYVAGIGFALGAIMKFKQHKDNPTQIPIGGPISLLFIGAALLFFPSVLQLAGSSIFGTTTTAGASGTAWGG